MDKEKVKEFLVESNLIEDESRDMALVDAWRCWDYGYDNKDNITLAVILEMHDLLMERIIPNDSGMVRRCAVSIGGKIKRFISMQLIEDDIERWLKKYKNLTKGDPKEAHIAFEDIHPFVDGNGRTGRILWQIHRLNIGMPLKVIHAGKEQIDYYKWFR